jgi:RHS repeat-associated protein
LITLHQDANAVTQSTETHYLYKDHLGSLDLITDASGAITDELSFDAWGQRRSGLNWSDVNINQLIADYGVFASIAPPTTRGFTGHEMADEVGVIHMNGRIYDPRLGRFLQADPFVQEPELTQSLNRYSYVRNNPLNATDPSGFFFSEILDGLVTIVAGVVGFFNPAAGLAILEWWAGFRTYVYAIEYGLTALNSFSNGDYFTGVVTAAIAFTNFNAIGQKTGATAAPSGAEEKIVRLTEGGTVSAQTAGNFANGTYTGAFFTSLNVEDGLDGETSGSGWFKLLGIAQTAAAKLDKSIDKKRNIDDRIIKDARNLEANPHFFYALNTAHGVARSIGILQENDFGVIIKRDRNFIEKFTKSGALNDLPKNDYSLTEAFNRTAYYPVQPQLTGYIQSPGKIEDAVAVTIFRYGNSKIVNYNAYAREINAPVYVRGRGGSCTIYGAHESTGC